MKRNRKKYIKFIDKIISRSDCVCLQIELIECVYSKINDLELKKIYDIHLDKTVNITSTISFEEWKQGIYENHYKDIEIVNNIFNTLKSLNNSLLFKMLSNKYGTSRFFNTSLILGYKITPDVIEYLKKVDDVFEWMIENPSDISFYSRGKCILSTIAHEEGIYTPDIEVYNLIKKYYNISLEDGEMFFNLKYPYSMNNMTIEFMENDI